MKLTKSKTARRTLQEGQFLWLPCVTLALLGFGCGGASDSQARNTKEASNHQEFGRTPPSKPPKPAPVTTYKTRGGEVLPLNTSTDYDRATSQARKDGQFTVYHLTDATPAVERPQVGRCGVRTYQFKQARVGSRWGRLEVDHTYEHQGAFAPLEPCEFPAKNKKWRSLTSQAESLMKKELQVTPSDDDVVTAPQDQWIKVRDESSSKVVARALQVQHFSKEHSRPVNACLEENDKVVCEESGSNTVRSLHLSRHYLDEAQRFNREDALLSCRLAAWHAMRNAQVAISKRAQFKGTKRWAEDLVYRARPEGDLNEEQAFALLEERRAGASKLFLRCGGSAKLVKENQLENDATRIGL